MRRNGEAAGAFRVTMGALTAPEAALIGVAFALPDADDPDLGARMAAALAAGADPVWLEETVLMTVLFAGFPRALIAARQLRRLQPVQPGEDATEYARWPEWRARGEATCRAVYGDHYEKLRPHVADLHPALDQWVIIDGYGRTIGRPGMTLALRELAAVGVLIPQRVPRQLHSHLRGALNTGASKAQVEAVLDLAESDPLIPGDRAATARRLWRDIAPRT